jgi:hypothetical protein
MLALPLKYDVAWGLTSDILDVDLRKCNETENASQTNKSSEQEHCTQSQLSSCIDLKFPYHGNGKSKYDQVSNERKDSVRHANHNKCIGNAMPRLSFVPEIRDRGALKNVTRKSSNCPQGSENPDSEGYPLESLGAEEACVEYED